MVLNDPLIEFTDRNSKYSELKGFTESYDKKLQDTGFSIINDSFDLNNILIYDVRGAYAYFLQLFNPGEGGDLHYKVEFATQEVEDPESLPESSWFPKIPDTIITSTEWSASDSTNEFVRATPKVTFIRISLHVTNAAPTIVTGVMSVI